MKLLAKENLSEEHEPAARVIEASLLVMQSVRAEINSRQPAGLSLSQFRALAYLSRFGSASLTDIADHIELTPPTVSKMVDALVKRGLVTREVSPRDRRCLILCLTRPGRETLEVVRDHAFAHLESVLKGLSPEDYALVTKAMSSLVRVLAPES